MVEAMGVCGYLLLGEFTPGDVLSALNSHTGALQLDVSAARFCVAVKVGCSYAMLSFVARNCIKDLMIGTDNQFTYCQFMALTVVFVAATMVVAIVAPGVQVVISFAGVVVVIMAFIFPGGMLLTMQLQPRHTPIGWAMICLGVVLGAISFAVQVHSVVATKK